MKIIIEELDYSYPKSKSKIFDKFNFQAESGITLLKGFSGCGKSSLLRLIASLLKPSGGLIQVDSTYSYGSINYLRHEIGFVFQQFNLLPLASVRRNIEIASQLAGKSSNGINDWLETFGLTDLANKKPIQLSGGQLQRAAMARALAKRPSVLLLDEPTSGLDTLNTQLICDVLTNKLDKETLCIIATHDNRLNHLTNEILDFNTFLPMEEHLQALARKPNFSRD